MDKSPIETEIGCPHFGSCGVALIKEFPMKRNVKFKESLVLELFEREGIKDFNYLGIEESPRIEGYRNKMEYTFWGYREGRAIIFRSS